MIIPDVLRQGLALVICGTAPSRASREAQAYYAHPGNIFWKTLFEVGLTPRLLAPRQYPEVLAFGIGLTDLNKTEWGADSELSPSAFEVGRFVGKMAACRPRVIAFDSKYAAATYFGRKTVSYGRQAETLAGSILFVVPSTSGRARRYFDITPWRDLALTVDRYRADG
ncbi:MAG: mismatch-specific DNA-glycosylase [Rhodospirillaceae bacterium]